jgi:DNA-binding XRE family transcriptional regulator
MSMDKRKRKLLESAGWNVGGTRQFLALSAEEMAIVEVKLGLANALKEQRDRRRMTQEQLGKLLGSSQSRVAKMEAADPSVSIDLMVRSLLRMGASSKDVASYIAPSRRKRAA